MGKNNESAKKPTNRFRWLVKPTGAKELQQCFSVYENGQLVRHVWLEIPTVQQKDLPSYQHGRDQ